MAILTLIGATAFLAYRRGQIQPLPDAVAREVQQQIWIPPQIYHILPQKTGIFRKHSKTLNGPVSTGYNSTVAGSVAPAAHV